MLSQISLWVLLSVAGAFTLAQKSMGAQGEEAVTAKTGEVSHLEKHWFQGSVEEAYKIAKKQHKHMILYWGAQWCPPCNDLKDQVFAHPEFPSFASSYIMVYLDGDTEGAQSWGEKLKVSGYPTVLLMNQNGKEMFRFSSGMDFVEFKLAINSAVASKSDLKKTLVKINQTKSKQAKISKNEWEALMATYFDEAILGVDAKGVESILKKVWEKCPAEFVDGKSLFAANIWEFSVEEDSTLKDVFKKNEDLIIEQVLSSGTTMDAARNFLMSSPEKKIALLREENKEKVRHHVATYLRGIAKDANRAPSERATALEGAYALDLLGVNANKEKINAATLDMSNAILQATKTSHEEAATYPGIASIIEKVSGAKAAVAFLESKLPSSKTPWYFESMLSSLEKELGNKDKSIEWSERAKDSSKGSATRLQWISRDVVLKTKILNQSEPKIAMSINEFLTEAKKYNDNFSGRNLAAHKRVAGAIKDLGPNGEDIHKKTIEYCSGNQKCLSIYSIK
jgi:protein disulfide-isomerase